ncbi:MAG: 30S ribosomal protein S7 [Candidatus Aenigmarchaeota archaeon]|nr:30S ribosomal protein S7 [Candidatus Aenigmarchaeota archaeon]
MLLLFNKWDMSGVKVEDGGLEKLINIKPVVVPKTYGRYSTEFIHKKKMPIVERFMNKLMVPGHKGKKHKLTSGKCSGNTESIMISMKKAFTEIENKTKQNPVQILVKAIENSAPLEEVAAYRLGGIIARKAVVMGPGRRIDIALRHLTQGIYKADFQKKKQLYQVIAEELIAASKADGNNHAVSERNRIEKEAEGAR